MKFKIIVLVLLQLVFYSWGQDTGSIAVTFDKTVHIIFPDKVIYVDLGSESIMASSVENLPCILRVKAAERNFKGETNLSVVLENRKMYCFNVYYMDTLTTTSIQVGETENGKDSLLFKIYKSNLRKITRSAVTSQGITLSLLSIYSTDEKTYLNIEIKNESKIPFTTDMVTFSLEGKRKNSEEVETIEAMDTTGEMKKLAYGGSYHLVFSFKPFFLEKDRKLNITAVEKGGNRRISLIVYGEMFNKMTERIEN